MPVTIPLDGPFAENGLLARCTGKIIGRQRLAENRNTSFMMEHHGRVWKYLRAGNGARKMLVAVYGPHR